MLTSRWPCPAAHLFLRPPFRDWRPDRRFDEKSKSLFLLQGVHAGSRIHSIGADWRCVYHGHTCRGGSAPAERPRVTSTPPPGHPCVPPAAPRARCTPPTRHLPDGRDRQVGVGQRRGGPVRRTAADPGDGVGNGRSARTSDVLTGSPDRRPERAQCSAAGLAHRRRQRLRPG
jgi:hypothetical protein